MKNDSSCVQSTVPSGSIAIVGGGLAGLAAAAALVGRGFQVELFEAKRRLGGRAGAYLDRESSASIDHCQHVGMGCCTNLLDFCQRTGIAGHFTRYETLHFYGPEGQRCDFRGSRWLPAPLHLAPTLLRLNYLTLLEKLGIARALLQLARTPAADSADAPTIGAWLVRQRQSPRAIEYFWQVVLVSALGESLDRASLAAARKVFVDGFLTSREAYPILVPQISLGELYDQHVASWLREQGAALHLGTAIERVEADNDGGMNVLLAGGERRQFAAVVATVPWRRAAEVLSHELREQVPLAAQAAQFGSAPITGVHLWFDRKLSDLPHAVIVGRLSQWVFSRQHLAPGYYQVVISASRELAGRAREDVIAEVCRDLAAIWPAADEAKLLRWQMVTEQEAVFSVRPGLDAQRPAQRTAIPGLFLAGDWTATLWPATMEGAVRSGYLAAEGVLAQLGSSESLLVPDLPRSALARLVIGS